MIEVINGHKYKSEVLKGHKFFHSLGCRGKFKLAGFYKLPRIDETRWTYRCKCLEVSF